MMVLSRRILAFLVVLAGLMTACGSDPWEDLSKVGNTWEYQGENTGAVVTAKVLTTLKLGETVYAEIAPDFTQNSNLTELCSWDKDSKTFFHAGQSSRFNDLTRQFFLKASVIGALEGKENTAFTNDDATILSFLGEEKVEVPAGEYKTYKFARLNPSRGLNETWWYAEKVGIVKLENATDVFGLSKYTEGKEVDPVKLEATKAGVDFIQKFFAAAQEGELEELEAYFSEGEGQEDFADQAPELSLFVERIRDARPDLATWSINSKDVYGLRFLRYEDGAGEPSVWRVDAVMTLTNQEGELKINQIGITSKKLFD